MSSRELLNWGEENPNLETVGADIIGQSPDNWQRLMIVNKGSSHGIKKYMSVVTDEGLVGTHHLGGVPLVGGPAHNRLALRGSARVACGRARRA